MDNVFDIKGLTFSYGTNEVIKGLDLSIKQGKVTTLIGANGCGKSTLFNLITKNLRPNSGEIRLEGKDISQVKLKDFARQVAIVHQYNTAPADISVEKLVAFGRTPYHGFGSPSNSEEDEEKIKRALEITNTEKLKDKAVAQLSGGQKQRVAIAGIIAMKPDCILLDEPTAMLDPHGRDEVMKTVKMLNEQGVTIVLITHYMEEAAQAQRVVVIDGGEVIMDNVPKKIFSNVETMKNLGLDVPQVTELCWELKKAGYDISTEIIHEDECVQKLYEMLK